MDVADRLPRDLRVRVYWHWKRKWAATTIQRVWRGRDVRDWLECPRAVEYNASHPRFVRRRGCPACLANRNLAFMTRRRVWESRRMTWAWLWRRPYIAYCYSPEGPLDPHEIPFVSDAVAVCRVFLHASVHAAAALATTRRDI